MSKQNQKFSIYKRIKSFVYAFNGLRVIWKEEHNARIHAIASIVVILLGILLKVSSLEWIALVICISFVIVTEIINSSIENISDYLTSEKNDTIKKIKDLAAAAVLISAIGAVIVGSIIFLPKISSIW